MKVLVQISAQYYENYAYFNGGQSWKPKGEQTFEMKVDDDWFLYHKEECVSAIKQILSNQSNSACKFEYVSHELVFCDPITISEEDFESVLEPILKEKYGVNETESQA
jgi:hypothetical protein